MTTKELEFDLEKQRRIYYQDLVYQTCILLDQYFDTKTVCGTYETPATEFSERLTELAPQIREAVLDEAREAYEAGTRLNSWGWLTRPTVEEILNRLGGGKS